MSVLFQSFTLQFRISCEIICSYSKKRRTPVISSKETELAQPSYLSWSDLAHLQALEARGREGICISACAYSFGTANTSPVLHLHCFIGLLLLAVIPSFADAIIPVKKLLRQNITENRHPFLCYSMSFHHLDHENILIRERTSPPQTKGHRHVFPSVQRKHTKDEVFFAIKEPISLRAALSPSDMSQVRQQRQQERLLCYILGGG